MPWSPAVTGSARPALSPSTETAAEEEHEGEEEHGPEGFVAMTAERASTAGIATETVKGGGLAAEILAQGIVALDPAGEAVLTAPR